MTRQLRNQGDGIGDHFRSFGVTMVVEFTGMWATALLALIDFWRRVFVENLVELVHGLFGLGHEVIEIICAICEVKVTVEIYLTTEIIIVFIDG